MINRLLMSLALVTTLSLGGCFATFGPKVVDNIGNITTVISGVNVSPQAVVIAVNAADGLQDTATIYLRLPLCHVGGNPVCRVREATRPLKNAVLTMRTARNSLEDWYALHPNTAAPASLYEKVTGAVSILGAIVTKYNIGPVVAVVSR